MVNYFRNVKGVKVLYLTPSEFSAYRSREFKKTPVSERTVYNWIEMGMPTLSIGDDVSTMRMIPVNLALRWLTAQRHLRTIRK